MSRTDATEATNGQTFDALVRHRDLILVTGKGGVGKSTLVAALAQLAAKRRGHAVAVELAAHPRLPTMVSGGNGIELLNIEAERSLPAVLGRMLKLPTLLSAALNNRVLKLFARTSPAVVEMILLDELRELVDVHSRRNVPVIVDLPATGHAVTLLDTPRSVHRMLRIGPVASRARDIERLLCDHERCELVVVAIPEELPVKETIELVQRAAAVGLESHTVVMNQVPSAALEAEDMQLLEAMEQTGDETLGRTAGAARSEMESADVARSFVEQLAEAVPSPVVELPFVLDSDPGRRIRAVLESMNAQR